MVWVILYHIYVSAICSEMMLKNGCWKEAPYYSIKTFEDWRKW